VIRSSLLAPIAVACSFAAASSAAQNFVPNRIYISASDGSVTETDFAGHGLRTLAAPTDGSIPSGLQFGPDGNLWAPCANNNTVVRWNAAGSVVATNPAGGAATDLAFTRYGNSVVFCSNPPKLVEWAPDGSLVGEVALPVQGTANGGCLGPDGHAYVADSNLVIREFETSGVELQAIPLPPQFATRSLARLRCSPYGTLCALLPGAADTAFAEFDGSGALIATFQIPAVAGDFAFGPDGHIYFPLDSSVYVTDRAGIFQRSIAAAPQTSALSVAFSPFRFLARCTGIVTRPNAVARNISENAVLTCFPGTGTTYLSLTDNPDTDTDLASVFLRTHVAFHGFETSKSLVDKTRVVQGSHVGPDATLDGTAALSLYENGKIGTPYHEFAPKTVRGVVHLAANLASLDGYITVLKQLK
jgi:streptogramin lyase